MYALFAILLSIKHQPFLSHLYNIQGEALCALLNSSGIVDGVISNDGDCLLFGAKTIYTNFSLENLENRKVQRYEANKLIANLDGRNNSSSRRTIKLSQEDLVAFAMLCGSDMVGNGIPHCGYKKAVQFLSACKHLSQNANNTTCLDELLSWSTKTATTDPTKSKEVHLDCDDDGPSTIPSSRCCSLCLHSGDKRSHEKHGCTDCGTGEGCYIVTTNEKILLSLKSKATKGTIVHYNVVMDYFTPNNNNVPSSLTQLKSNLVNVDAAKLFATPLIVKGRTRQTSHEYIKQTLPQLIARLDLWDKSPRNRYATTANQKYKPIPIRIDKQCMRQSIPCYEIMWSINISNNNEVDNVFQFCTIERTSYINSAFPQLIKVFQQEERRKQQGKNEEERRKRYGQFRTNNQPQRQRQRQRLERPDFAAKKPQGGKRKRRERNFDTMARVKKGPVAELKEAKSTSDLGNDVLMLMDNLPSSKSPPSADSDDLTDDENHAVDVADKEYVDYNEQPCYHDHHNQYCQSVNYGHSTADDYNPSSDNRLLHSTPATYLDHGECSEHRNYECNYGLKPGDDAEYEYQHSFRQHDEHVTCGETKDSSRLDFATSSSYHGSSYHDYHCDDLIEQHPADHFTAAQQADTSISQSLLNRNEQIFCNFGIQVEMTPLISRRRCLFW